MTAPTPEEKLDALPLRLREAVERVQKARKQEARVLEEGAKENGDGNL